ncbi:hypothetical protein [Escherichia fergusonii]
MKDSKGYVLEAQDD